MTGAVRYTETSLSICQQTRRNSPVALNLQRKLHCHKVQFYMNIRENNLLAYLLTYVLTYLLTYLLHGAESFLRS